MKRERRLAEPGLKSCAKTQKVASQVSFSLITLVLSLARASPQLRDESLTIENKIDWFRRSDFGDVIGLTRLRRSSLLFPHSCWQDDLKTVFTKIHTQMINRYRIWRSLSRIRKHYIYQVGTSGKFYSPFSSQTRAWIDGIHLELTDFWPGIPHWWEQHVAIVSLTWNCCFCLFSTDSVEGMWVAFIHSGDLDLVKIMLHRTILTDDISHNTVLQVAL